MTCSNCGGEFARRPRRVISSSGIRWLNELLLGPKPYQGYEHALPPNTRKQVTPHLLEAGLFLGVTRLG
jgi:hypothetical protein